MQCKWCGVERDAPAQGPHACDPQRVREKMADEAAMSLEGYASRYPSGRDKEVVVMLVHSQAKEIRFAGKHPIMSSPEYADVGALPLQPKENG